MKLTLVGGLVLVCFAAYLSNAYGSIDEKDEESGVISRIARDGYAPKLRNDYNPRRGKVNRHGNGYIPNRGKGNRHGKGYIPNRGKGNRHGKGYNPNRGKGRGKGKGHKYPAGKKHHGGKHHKKHHGGKHHGGKHHKKHHKHKGKGKHHGKGKGKKHHGKGKGKKHHGKGKGKKHGKGRRCRRADVVFVVDVSNSIAKSDLKKILSFIVKIVKKLKIGKNKVEIGVAKFATKTKIEFSIGKSKGKDDIIKAVKHLDRHGFCGGSNIGGGIKKGAYDLIYHGRKKASKVIIAITDGNWNTGHDPVFAAQYARNAFVETIGVGVGNQIKKDVIYTIAGERRR